MASRARSSAGTPGAVPARACEGADGASANGADNGPRGPPAEQLDDGHGDAPGGQERSPGYSAGGPGSGAQLAVPLALADAATNEGPSDGGARGTAGCPGAALE